MGAELQRLRHIMFFPLMAAGHMIPILDVAKLFTSRNFKATIVTTPLNAPVFTKSLESYKPIGPPINVEIIPFPSKEVGLPAGVENVDQCSSNEMTMKLLKATELLQASLEEVLAKNKVDCLVADFLYPFASNAAAKFNIPRLVFHGTNNLAQCVAHAMFKYEPYKSVSAEDEEFVIPHLPHEIKIRLSQLPDFMRGKGDKKLGEEWVKLCCRALEAEEKSFGVIVNSFYELEPDYADYYQNVMGRKTWNIGPVSLYNGENEAKFNSRGKDSSIDEYECLKWLDSKKPNSVVYICFGSVVEVSTSQLQEIALGLEASEQDFIWVVRRSNEDNEEGWLPQGFEKRTEGKGIVIKGWAPQVLILNHSAMGAFVTHCGWNSTLEAISYGVPMITWPVFAEQFYNEILVTNILKIGISVGAKECNRFVEVTVIWKDFKEAIRRAMVGEEALEIRSRANKVKEIARKAVQLSGSSYRDMGSLLQELSSDIAEN